MIGKRLAHYEIVEKLGEGGMGVVYKARDTRLDRFVALKVLPPEKVANPERKARFIQEAKAASALNHPNIVTVYDINSADGIDYMAMEFIPGRTLDELIPKTGLRLKEALKFAVQISDALSAAHAARIVHRDLKPANIMVNDRGLAKILDFGLAKLTSVEAAGPDDETRTQGALTEEGTVMGSAPYMSPEQAQGLKLDHRSDIFSFGIVFYEMLSGQRPFQGESRMGTLAAIIENEPPPLAQIREGIPREIGRMVAQCLRKDIERRAQSMAQIKLELEDLRDDSPSGTSPPPAPAYKGRWLWASAAALVVLAAAVGAWRFFPLGGGSEAPLSAVPLTAYPGRESDPSLSPDGNQVAFAWDGDKENGPPQIYLSLIGRGSPLQLTKEGASFAPAWSPDGQTMAFLRPESDSFFQIRLIPALGGPEQQIARMRLTSRLSWSPDSKRIYFSAREEGMEGPALYVLSSSGGEPRRITKPSKVEFPADQFPAVSPDGEKLAFVRAFADYNQALMVQHLNQEGGLTGQPKPLVQGIVISPAWSSDSRHLFYILGQSENRIIFRIGLDGGQPRRLEGAGEDAVQVSIAAKGSRMVYATGFSDLNLYRQQLPSTSSSPAPAPVKILSSTRFELSPIISPDGTKIAFSSSRGGVRQIWVGNADGSNPVAVTSFTKGVAGSPSWSADSRWIAFDARPAGLSDIFVVRHDGSSLRQLTDHPAEDHVPCWAPDGKWIYFTSLRSGVRQIFRMPAAGGEAVQISKRGGYPLQASLDGKWVYYSANDGGIWRMPADGGEETQVISENLASRWAFSLTPSGVYYVAASSRSEKGFPVKFFDLANNKATPLLTLSKWPQLHISVSADGRYLYYAQNDRSDFDLMLVENLK